ncbi:MAG: hypothetical protein ISR69_03360 [Gammaproteobacteria bacterium]|nr:hypothetical protein [Gammaproteobacteria bacterium]
MVPSNNMKEQLVETLCGHGCQYVNQLLASSKMQQECDLLNQVSQAEKEWILAELRSIMSVYENSGSCTV